MNPALAQHRPALLGLAYRITGDPSAAEDVVQETMLRALERPPRDTSRPWGPWLMRVASNLARDHLRRRRRQRYFGTWLPGPIDTAGPQADWVPIDPGPEARFSARQSVLFAFLVALESLTPQQRCVLVLRDVYGFSVRETANALDMGASNVKVTHLRARRALDGYELPDPPSAERNAELEALLTRLFSVMAAHDVPAIESLLSDDAIGRGDGGGLSPATPRPHVGPRRVAAALAVVKLQAVPLVFEYAEINGEPALLIELPEGTPDSPIHVCARIEMDACGRARVYEVISSPVKLRGLRHRFQHLQ